MSENIAQYLEKVASDVGLEVREPKNVDFDRYAECPSNRIIEVTEKLMKDHNVHHLSTMIVLDLDDGYHIYYPFSIPFEEGKFWGKLIIDVKVDKDNAVIDSITPILPGAVIAEREVFDMMGIKFNNHPDHRRLLTPDIMPENIYPLRKDISAKEIREKLAVEAEKRMAELE